jgi:hypothetical protein
MPYRFTNTDKWNDTWFCELKPFAKLLFLYLCDQCDAAGFLEINTKKIAFELSIGKQEAESALTGIERSVVFSADRKFVFLRNFIKHQKNYPLNEKNPAHRGILKILREKMHLFGFQSVEDYFRSPLQGASKGLQSPIGKGNSNTTGSYSIGGVGEEANKGDESVGNRGGEGEKKEGVGEKKGGAGEKKIAAAEIFSPLSFESAWALYGKKGNRKTSERRWANLKNHCREAAIAHIPLYVQSTPDVQYRKNFETYINQEAWNDRIINRNGHEANCRNGAGASGVDEELMRHVAAGIARGRAARENREVG